MSLLGKYNIVYEKKELDTCINALSNSGDITLLCDYINNILNNANKDFFAKFSENSLQSIYYVLLSLYPDVFTTKVEFELSLGRGDLIIINKDSSKHSVIVEFKYLKSKERMNRTIIKEARGQIERYRKDNILPDKTRCYIIINKLGKLEHFEEVK